MFGFDGAMSVIQETDEPDDDMTRKSSSMHTLRQGSQSFATPLGHQSYPMKDSGLGKKHVFTDYAIINPQAVMNRVLAQAVPNKKGEPFT